MTRGQKFEWAVILLAVLFILALMLDVAGEFVVYGIPLLAILAVTAHILYRRYQK